METLQELPETSTKPTEEPGLESELDSMAGVLGENDLDAITACVEEITKVFSLAPTLVVSSVFFLCILIRPLHPHNPEF